MKNILLLAGTGEARTLAELLAMEAGLHVTASLAGATRQPDPIAAETRHGGFGGDDGFADYLESANIDAVLDATHPFAMNVSARSARICTANKIPYLAVNRDPWVAQEGDRWISVEDPGEAADHIPEDARVFLATGRTTLTAFAALEGRKLYLRQIDPPTEPFPFEGGEFIIARPPFSLQSEKNLFRALKIDWLIAKNAGGTGGRAKLDAARALGIPVLMLDRPTPPPEPHVTTVADALRWVKAL